MGNDALIGGPGVDSIYGDDGNDTITGGVDDEVMLQQGYAVASNSLNVMGNDCAELMTIETMMMTKEHFIEAYGAPKFTLGFGGTVSRQNEECQ